MAYRIKRSTIGRDVTFFLSGEIDSDHVAELEALIATEASRLVCLDLAEVTLMTRDAVKALARVEGPAQSSLIAPITCAVGLTATKTAHSRTHQWRPFITRTELGS